jgi:hypothetical protein
MKAQLRNTGDRVCMLLQMLSKINQEEARCIRPVKGFLLQKLGVLTYGEIGEDPNSGIVVEPLDQRRSGQEE